MPRKHVFLCCERAGTDLSQKDEISCKNRKNGHESRSWSNSKSRGSKSQLQSFIYSRWARLVPEIYFEEITHSALGV
jgi:hypothetical protein